MPSHYAEKTSASECSACLNGNKLDFHHLSLSKPQKSIIDNKNKVKGAGVHVKEFARP
jgi:hypothetical protein